MKSVLRMLRSLFRGRRSADGPTEDLRLALAWLDELAERASRGEDVAGETITAALTLVRRACVAAGVDYVHLMALRGNEVKSRARVLLAKRDLMAALAAEAERRGCTGRLRDCLSPELIAAVEEGIAERWGMSVTGLWERDV